MPRIFGGVCELLVGGFGIDYIARPPTRSRTETGVGSRRKPPEEKGK